MKNYLLKEVTTGAIMLLKKHITEGETDVYLYYRGNDNKRYGRDTQENFSYDKDGGAYYRLNTLLHGKSIIYLLNDNRIRKLGSKMFSTIEGRREYKYFYYSFKGKREGLYSAMSMFIQQEYYLNGIRRARLESFVF